LRIKRARIIINQQSSSMAVLAPTSALTLRHIHTNHRTLRHQRPFPTPSNNNNNNKLPLTVFAMAPKQKVQNKNKKSS
jgi:hypothetical protein